MIHAGSIDSLIAPRSVAVVGASSDPNRIGGRPVAYLKQAGFPGSIYPVNPSRSELQGLRCFPNLDAIVEDIDCAIIAVAADKVEDTIRACCARGVRSAVVFSSGFAEIGPQGRDAQDRMTELARMSGMRILGPNVVGLYNAKSRAFLTFSGAVAPIIDGPVSQISVVSQSGGYAGYLLALAEDRGLRFGKWISTGNEADVDVAEITAYLADDPDTKVILAYIEGVKDGDRFLAALERARQTQKAVVLLKVGRTERGSAAAASHTASLAGSDAVFSAACRQYGAIRASTATEMLDVAYGALCNFLPRGRRMAVVTVSGGVGVELADLAEDHRLELPDVPAAAQEKLRALVPFSAVRNPIDITAQITNDPGLLEQSLAILSETGAFDTLFVFLGHAAAFPALADRFAIALGNVRETFPEQPIILCALGDAAIRQRYETAGCLVYREPAPAITAVAALIEMAELRSRPTLSPRRPIHISEPTEHLNEFDAKQLLARFGIPGPGERFAITVSEAGKAADELGYPVALKILSRDILHKSDVGGVVLRLTTRGDVEVATERMLREIPLSQPAARIDGILVERMAKPGVECIVGLHHDPSFGPVMMFGLGGVNAEIWRDVSIRLAPLGETDARAMVTELRSYPLLAGYRGAIATDIDAIIDTLMTVSRIPWEAPGRVRSVEINPLLVLPKGQGVAALDAVVACAAGIAHCKMGD